MAVDLQIIAPLTPTNTMHLVTKTKLQERLAKHFRNTAEFVRCLPPGR